MLTKYLTVFFVSMVPLIELRGAIPIGVGLGLPLWQEHLHHCHHRQHDPGAVHLLSGPQGAGVGRG